MGVKGDSRAGVAILTDQLGEDHSIGAAGQAGKQHGVGVHRIRQGHNKRQSLAQEEYQRRQQYQPQQAGQQHPPVRQQLLKLEACQHEARQQHAHRAHAGVSGGEDGADHSRHGNANKTEDHTQYHGHGDGVNELFHGAAAAGEGGEAHRVGVKGSRDTKKDHVGKAYTPQEVFSQHEADVGEIGDGQAVVVHRPLELIFGKHRAQQ